MYIAELKSAGERHRASLAYFRQAKEEYEIANSKFKSELDELKRQNQKKRESDRDIAIRAGIPSQYLSDIWMIKKSDGAVNIYFGGAGKSNGPGHGHYAMNSEGEVTYRRDPFDPHGAKNFTGANGKFNGVPAKIVMSDMGNSNHIDIYYGGSGEPDGLGHNHISVIKESIRFWREDGLIMIDERLGIQ